MTDSTPDTCRPLTAGSTACFDSIPPTTRGALEIAADLVLSVDCKHRPLACEAARKLKQITDAETERMMAESLIGDATVAVGKSLLADLRKSDQALALVRQQLENWKWNIDRNQDQRGGETLRRVVANILECCNP